jgi:hypothetical protein
MDEHPVGAGYSESAEREEHWSVAVCRPVYQLLDVVCKRWDFVNY